MFSQTVEYALRAMLCLASQNGTALTSERIAQQTQVPASYLSKVLRDLVRAQLVSSFRGPNGGFVLAHAAAQITVLQVVNAVDPIRRIARCPMNNPEHHDLCPLHRSLDDALAHIEGVFGSTTLEKVRSLPNQASPCLLTHPTILHRRESA